MSFQLASQILLTENFERVAELDKMLSEGVLNESELLRLAAIAEARPDRDPRALAVASTLFRLAGRDADFLRLRNELVSDGSLYSLLVLAHYYRNSCNLGEYNRIVELSYERDFLPVIRTHYFTLKNESDSLIMKIYYRLVIFLITVRIIFRGGDQARMLFQTDFTSE